jgi:hypothetical protein
VLSMKRIDSNDIISMVKYARLSSTGIVLRDENRTSP